MSRLAGRKSFTLIEILLAVAIFVAMVVLIFATLSRSAASSQKADELRTKSEAVRRVVDQITNDFTYLYLDETVKLKKEGYPGGEIDIRGFVFDENSFSYNLFEPGPGLILIVKYPHNLEKDAEGYLTIKKYYFDETGGDSGRNTLKYQEHRDCNLLGENGNEVSCNEGENSEVTDLFPDSFAVALSDEVDNDGNELPTYSSFKAVTISGARPEDQKPIWQNASLKISLTVKPNPPGICGDPNQRKCRCDELPTGSCYTLSTTLYPRVVQ